MTQQSHKISALAIVFNEEHNIREYLDNMSFADEIIVVDSFSTDNTPAIIKADYPHVKFYQRAFDDFSSQRNYTLDLSSNDWVTFFDADERVTEKGISEIVATVENNPEETAFWVKRIFYYEGRPLVNNNFNEDRTARLFRRSKCRYSDKLVHEQLVIKGKSRVLKHAIHHYSFINKEDFLKKRLQYSKLKARELYQKGVKTNVFHFTVRPGFRFFKYYILKLGFFNGRRGYDIAKILGYHVYMRYVYLREMYAADRGCSLLVIQQKMIGDVLASSTICQSLKLAYPKSRIDYMVYDFTRPVIANNPYIDRVILFNEKYRENKLEFIKFIFKIRKNDYYAVIDAYGKWESAIISLFSGATRKIGYKKWYTSFFYTETVETDKTVPNSALFHRMQLAAALTHEDQPIIHPKIYLTAEESENARQLLSEKLTIGKPVIMISVLGSDAIKSLPSGEMAKVLDLISQNTNAQLLFNYLPAQKSQAQEIYNLCSPETQKRIYFELYINGLREFMAVLSHCNALVGNEGGAVNMAKALDIPTFTIFSPWIKKSSWNMLEDNEKHVAVHLQDYFPEMYGDIHPKEFKSRSIELYTHLKASLFEERLKKYVKAVTAIQQERSLPL